MYILTIPESVLTFVCGFGILQGVLLAAFIYFHPKSEKSVNIFLALYIICTSAIMSLPFTINMIGWRHGYLLYWIPSLGGPLLYLYLKSFREIIHFRKIVLHLVFPVLFFLLSYWNVTRLNSRLPATDNVPADVLQNPVTISIQLIRAIQQLFYFFLARRTLLSYQRSIRQLFSETSNIDLQWARFLVNGYLALVLLYVAIYPLMLRYSEQFNLLLLLNMSLATPYIYIATYKGILQHTIWQLKPEVKKENIEEQMQIAGTIDANESNDEQRKPEKTGLNESRLDELVKKVTYLMEQEKIYQEPELTLQQLAKQLDVPVYQVSQTLNEGMKRNFYDVVNGYRVEEAKRLLLDDKNKNYTILSVGFEAGFNSKTTFNTVFKKFTGLTPTAFRDKQKMIPAVPV